MQVDALCKYSSFPSSSSIISGPECLDAESPRKTFETAALSTMFHDLWKVGGEPNVFQLSTLKIGY
ncbi:hypothetical protein M413DRAFT_447647 [Hebeloma cylindrosporum]|uniref:Uncharacterized protein n=1 Tax=Hebeloma cylindrosporum TaxID=76867 RepID=A0A0C3C364_HEBCY|nr:hypothetical protein M413DRAFT_447647 [Hebeloma cylindrosporum h7]